MTCYLAYPRDRIIVKGYFLLFPFIKNMGKNIDKDISKNLGSKYRLKILDPLNNQYLKLLQKKQLKKQQKQLVIWFVIKLLLKLQKNHQKIL